MPPQNSPQPKNGTQTPSPSEKEVGDVSVSPPKESGQKNLGKDIEDLDSLLEEGEETLRNTTDAGENSFKKIYSEKKSEVSEDTRTEKASDELQAMLDETPPAKNTDSQQQNAKQKLASMGNAVAEVAQKQGGEDKLRETLKEKEVGGVAPNAPIVTPEERAASVPNAQPIKKESQALPLQAKVSEEKKSEKRPQEPSEDESEKKQITSVRTFRGDISRVLKQKQTTVVSAAAAESKRSAQKKDARAIEGEAPTARSLRPYLLVLASGLLIAGGFLAFALYYFFAPTPITRVAVSEIPAHVFVEKKEEILVRENDTRTTLMNALGNARERTQLGLGQLQQFYVIEPTTSAEEGVPQYEVVSTEAFIKRLGWGVSNSFVRSLNEGFTFGFHVFDGNQPFFVFSSNFFESSLAGMLEWEPTLHTNLVPLFGDALREEFLIGTSTRSRPANLPFEDEIISNKEVRVLYDFEGREVVVYGFPNTRTLILTTNRHTFTELVTRMSSIRI